MKAANINETVVVRYVQLREGGGKKGPAAVQRGKRKQEEI